MELDYLSETAFVNMQRPMLTNLPFENVKKILNIFFNWYTDLVGLCDFGCTPDSKAIHVEWYHPSSAADIEYTLSRTLTNKHNNCSNPPDKDDFRMHDQLIKPGHLHWRIDGLLSFSTYKIKLLVRTGITKYLKRSITCETKEEST